MKFTRITYEPGKLGGAPCIRGLRIPVSTIVEMTAQGMSSREIREHLPDLTPEDIAEALHYAAEAVREQALPLIGS